MLLRDFILKSKVALPLDPNSLSQACCIWFLRRIYAIARLLFVTNYYDSLKMLW